MFRRGWTDLATLAGSFGARFASSAKSAAKGPNYVASLEKTPIDKVRNIGIIAHIDAGKTTTTERMLYYSGLTSHIGNVDEGDTVTDYLSQEKDRGITIQSAAVTVPWNGYKVNVIDTPGHADFTFEVTRSLRVLDGAVTILDAVAGVEAQTEKVWRQAKDLGIPMIAYINKMDRDGAGYGRTVKEIVGRLGTRAVLVNTPYFVEDAETQQPIFKGVLDVIDCKLLVWDETAADGRKVSVKDARKIPELAEQCETARQAAIEELGEFDESVVDSFLELEDYMKVPSSVIKSALRKATLARWATPILCGSSFKNIGVQPLMDSIIEYLPNPTEVSPPEVTCSSIAGKKRKGRKNARKNAGGASQAAAAAAATEMDLPVKMDKRLGCIVNGNKRLTTALAFKVIMHPNRGLMTFVRVYSGKLTPSMKVTDTRNNENIRIGKLLVLNGNVPQEVKSLSAGNIGVITGTDEISTGDTLVAHSSAPRENYAKLLPIEVPPPVFSVSIEPTTVADTRKLESSLKSLLREDPSLKLDYDDEEGQMILAGMGELHLEITKDRLIHDMKVAADIGPVKVTYKETITQPTQTVTKLENNSSSSSDSDAYKVTLSIEPFEGDAEDTEQYNEPGTRQLDFDNNLVVFDEGSTPEFVTKALEAEEYSLDVTYESMINAVLAGATGALQVGGKIARLPIHSVAVRVKEWSLPTEASTASPLIQATRLAIKEALEKLPESASTLLEPVMNVSIYLNDEDLGTVSQDLMSARNASISDIAEQDGASTGEDAAWAREQAEKTYIPFDPTLQYIKSAETGGKKVIKAEAPLKDMVGYLPKLRSLTQGRGVYDMEYARMQRANPDRVRQILEE